MIRTLIAAVIAVVVLAILVVTVETSLNSTASAARVDTTYDRTEVTAPSPTANVHERSINSAANRSLLAIFTFATAWITMLTVCAVHAERRLPQIETDC